MENPVREIPTAIKSMIEPYQKTVISANVNKYFKPNAKILHPLWSRETIPGDLIARKAVYRALRFFAADTKVEVHELMFNESRTRFTVDLTEHMDSILPYNFLAIDIRLFMRLELIQDENGTWKITREEDNVPDDLIMLGLTVFPGLRSATKRVTDVLRIAAGLLGSRMLFSLQNTSST
ncbi:hypothetical protein CROQUDRAFT_650181 [Cronartium quercuum f. sp. fusiforme G11]|uniref:SigF-like NTF2-like domain-containing protein n=1 Tax=Cronartium quercuum f. sp. fusiforme G11 TaxID=708437 RepID=A0A9P6NTU0_9BASI|nr:hypothetical protein CROQUDRAFT_650181 [Cronartium quercuum f. sp. fusiforme G11]